MTATATVPVTSTPNRTCKDCGRSGTRGFVESEPKEHRCAWRRFCQWRSESRAVNDGWR